MHSFDISIIYFCLKGRDTHTQIFIHTLLSVGLFLKWPKQPELGNIETKSQELRWCLPGGYQNSDTGIVTHCFWSSVTGSEKE